MMDASIQVLAGCPRNTKAAKMRAIAQATETMMWKIFMIDMLHHPGDVLSTPWEQSFLLSAEVGGLPGKRWRQELGKEIVVVGLELL